MKHKSAQKVKKCGSPKHVMLCAFEAQEGDRQERGHAHSQRAMSKADDTAEIFILKQPRSRNTSDSQFWLIVV